MTPITDTAPRASAARRACLALAAAGALAPSAATAQNSSPPPQLTDAVRQNIALAREHFAEASAIASADGGRLWGRSLAGPMIFADLDANLLYANQPDATGALTPAGEGVWVCHIPDDMAPANTATTWAGHTWTMILWPLPDSTYPRRRLMAHELFHRIQTAGESPGDDAAKIFIPPAASPAGAHLDTEHGRVWLRLEMRALIEALVREGDDRRRAISDALAFRELRRSASPSAREEERALEMNEGLAEYTGHRLCGLPAAALRDRAAVRLENDERLDSFARSFAYATGPAYALLLDEAAPGWNLRLTPHDDLGALLAAAAGIAPPSADESAAVHRADAYGGARVIQQERRREAQRLERLALYRARFVDGPTLTLPATSATSYSFNPYGTETLPGLGQVFRTMKVTDAWGALEVASGGALLVRSAAGKVEKYIVPAPTDATAAPLTGDGWTLRLADGWRIIPTERPGDSILTKDPPN